MQYEKRNLFLCLNLTSSCCSRNTKPESFRCDNSISCSAEIVSSALWATDHQPYMPWLLSHNLLCRGQHTLSAWVRGATTPLRYKRKVIFNPGFPSHPHFSNISDSKPVSKRREGNQFAENSFITFKQNHYFFRQNNKTKMASDRPDQSETEQENSDQQNDLQQLADLKIQEVSPELMIKHPLQVSQNSFSFY